MITKAVFPGTFDPITNGHVDIIKRASDIFPKLMIAVSESVHKGSRFNLDERLAFVKMTFSDYENIEVLSFSGLLVDFCKKNNVKVLIRGLRDQADFAYETKLATMNQVLSNEVQTVYIQPDRLYAFLSSTLIREVADLGGDLTGLVPEIVNQSLKT